MIDGDNCVCNAQNPGKLVFMRKKKKTKTHEEQLSTQDGQNDLER